MKKKSIYHPLRQLAVGGNPNATNKHKVKRSSEPISEDPLDDYLRSHNIKTVEFHTFVSSLNSANKVVTPFDCNYPQDRLVSDPLFNNYPLFIVMCDGVADVVKSINFCNTQPGIQCSLRAGGHNTAGYSVITGRVLIDVSNIKGIQVDTNAMTATVGAGVTWGEFNYEMDAYGLHTPGGGCSSVGMTGFTLGGGYGYTSMRWGMACDNLLEIQLVTASGAMVIANSTVNSDLFWACRGGTGGNFGVVVSLTYQLYPLKMVWPIQVSWPIGKAAEVLYAWQNQMTKTAPDTALGILGFLACQEINGTTPNGESCVITQPYFCIMGMYSGENKVNGAAALQPLLDVGDYTLLAPLWQQQYPYAQLNEQLLDNVEAVIPDNYNETKRCAYIETALTIPQYQQIVDYYCTTPSLYNICSLEPYGGAINAVPANATAFVHRDAYFDFFTDAFWLNPSDEQKAFDWLYNFYESTPMQGLFSTDYYQNYPNASYANWQNGYFGANYPQLQQVKSTWDPGNFFNFPQSIELPSTPKK